MLDFIVDFIVSIISISNRLHNLHVVQYEKKWYYYLVGLNILFVIYGFVIGPFSTVPCWRSITSHCRLYGFLYHSSYWDTLFVF